MRKLIYLLFPLMMLAGSSAFAENFAISYKLDGTTPIRYQSEDLEDPEFVSVDDAHGNFNIIGDGKFQIFSQENKTGKMTDENDIEPFLKGYGESENGELKYFISDGCYILYVYDLWCDTELARYYFQDSVIGMAIDKENNIAYVLTDGHELKKMKLNSDGTVWCETTVTVPETAKSLIYQEYYKELIVVTADNLDFYHPDTLDHGSFKHIPLNYSAFVRFTNSYIIMIHQDKAESLVEYYDYSGKLIDGKSYYVDNEIHGVLSKENGDLILKVKNRDPGYRIEYRYDNGFEVWQHEFEDNINSMCLSPDQDKIFVLTDDGKGDNDSELMCFDCYGEKKWTNGFADEMDVLICGKNRVFAVDGSNLTTAEEITIGVMSALGTVALAIIIGGVIFFIIFII